MTTFLLPESCGERFCGRLVTLDADDFLAAAHLLFRRKEDSIAFTVYKNRVNDFLGALLDYGNELTVSIEALAIIAPAALFARLNRTLAISALRKYGSAYLAR